MGNGNIGGGAGGNDYDDGTEGDDGDRYVAVCRVRSGPGSMQIGQTLRINVAMHGNHIVISNKLSKKLFFSSRH